MVVGFGRGVQEAQACLSATTGVTLPWDASGHETEQGPAIGRPNSVGY